MSTEWEPIETCPANIDVLLWQPKGKHQSESMIIGSIERNGWEKHPTIKFWVNPADISGYEWDCECTKPTMWKDKPEGPQQV